MNPLRLTLRQLQIFRVVAASGTTAAAAASSSDNLQSQFKAQTARLRD